MTANDSKSASSRVTARRLRRLFFDSLEDRRLMAGLNVFVFDDFDGSRTYDAASEGAVLARAVYIDLNRDAKYSSNEPFAVSNEQGFASFPDLAPGEYAVRLLGSNKAVVQTFPTQPAVQGVWADGFGLSKVVATTPAGMTWGISGNSLTLVNPAENQTVRSIRFGMSTVIDAVLKPSLDGEMSGYILTEGLDNLQVLWQVSTSANGTKRAISVDMANATQLFTLGDNVLVLNGRDTKQISSFDFGTAANRIDLASTVLTGLPSNVLIKSNGRDGILILSDAPSVDSELDAPKPSVVSYYQLSQGVLQLVGERQFPSKVLSSDISTNGQSIAVATIDGVSILIPQAGLPVKTTLTNAAAPIVFEPITNSLITGDSPSVSNLVVWNPEDWTQTSSIAIGSTKAISSKDASLSIDASGTRIVLAQDGTLYQHNIATPAAGVVKVAEYEQKQVFIGVKSIGRNLGPSLLSLESVSVDEDTQIDFDGSGILSKVSDLDGDNVIFVVRSGPRNGQLTWNQDGSGAYVPGANLDGQETIAVQAYDGLDWSEVQYLTIEIHATNDLPTGIEFSDVLVLENAPVQSVFGSLKVLDADPDAQYDFQISDDRFSVVDGTIRLVKGLVNFEEEPTIVLAVTALDRLHPQDTFTKTVTLRIKDENDAPTGISSPSVISVPELLGNLDVAKLAVIDQDASETYQWSVSDSRFTVVNGMLHLVEGQALDFESEPSVSLIVTATDSSGTFSVEKAITIQVTNQDDEPSELLITSPGKIAENVAGAVVGQVTVLDADQGEQYTFSISDSRFEVTTSGSIRLRAGASVVYSAPGIIDLTVFASSLKSSNRISGSLRLYVIKDPTPYHNDINPFDVDGDGSLTPLDPLIIINHINNNGIGPIEAPGEGEGPLPDLDVDGDGQVSPIDILILINKLNQQIEENKHSMDDFLSGEGESTSLIEPEAGIGPQTVASPANVATVQPLPGNNDMSLASYLADLNEDVLVKKSKRR